jgi:DNA-binding transcriptional MerR regulator
VSTLADSWVRLRVLGRAQSVALDVCEAVCRIADQPAKDQEKLETMIDRLRHELQQRLEQLRDETEKIGRALGALGPGVRPTRTASRAARARPAAAAAPKPPPASPRTRTAPTSKPKPRARTAPGSTKRTVLGALPKDGAMTAGEVAKATGLKIGTVSTTLSQAAKSGEVTKAKRGYQRRDSGEASATS